MIEAIKKKSIKNKIQFIEIAKDGTILESEDNLFKLEEGTSFFDAHPFFESIQYYFNEPTGSEFHLSCINLEIGDVIGIYDLDLDILESSAVLTVLDFTQHYKISNTLSQEKNESVIQAQLLQEREEFKNRFLANTSHELRSPLSTIMGFTTILQRSSLTLSQLHNLNVIKSSSEQLKNVIDDILDISRIEMGELKLQEERFDFNNFMTHIHDSYINKAKQNRIKFSSRLGKNIPQFLVGDKFRLNQILTNLLDNALKFTEEGQVTLKVKSIKTLKKKVQLVFEVSDTGIGIPKDSIDSIFESFAQIDENNAKKGTGLGLSIVRHLVRLMHGKIDVESTINRGTTFMVTLDFKISDNQIASKTTLLKNDESYKGKKYNILIAEDLEINQLLIIKILADYGKYYFDVASNGDQVVELLHQNDYDLVLMDLKMPKMDGYDTTRYIRHSEVDSFKNIPIIAVTAKVSTLERERCLKSGMNDYIGKPFTERELINKMDAILVK